MRSLALILAPFTLAGIAYATAQSLAAHDWLTAGPLLIVLAVGVLLIVPGDEAPTPTRTGGSAQAIRNTALGQGDR